MSDSLGRAADAARDYERLHVKALFGQWAEPVLDAAKVVAGHRLLDVACGTGVLARAAHARVGPTGAVTGLDIAPGMLAVAADLEPGVTWIEGDAGALPFDDDTFDVVVSQFGLMFFPDKKRAIREMLRCLRPGGLVAVAVWDGLEHSGAYPISVDLLERRAGSAAAMRFELRSCWVTPVSSEGCSRMPERWWSRWTLSTARHRSRACDRWSRPTSEGGFP